MRCAYPRRSPMGDYLLPCGQCMPCRINRQRCKVARCLLEAQHYQASSFVTLTYDDSNLPLGLTRTGSAPTLYKHDYQLFLKRWRKSHGDVRYVLSGEYGDRYGRPHYHLLMFGVDPFYADRVIRDVWGLGHVDVGMAEEQSIRYVCGYVLKKGLDHQVEDDQLDDEAAWTPAFTNWSRRPGIGAVAIPRLADACMTAGGAELVATLMDVPSQVRIGETYWPLDLFMRNRLREAIGIPIKSEERVSVQALELHSDVTDTEAAARRARHAKEYRRAKKAKIQGSL